MKHVGKMKNNGAPVAIVFRTLPGDHHSCLVVGTQGLGPTHHDSLMQLIESPEAQGTFELGSILSVRRFPDNNPMLHWLHSNGKLKKLNTNEVIVTAAPQNHVQLDELNKLIAEQKGVRVEDLSLAGKTDMVETSEIASVTELPVSTPDVVATTSVLDDSAIAKNLRSQADAMFKEAQTLRKQADDLDPPKKKATTAKSKKETA
jgi:hypothetical protein